MKKIILGISIFAIIVVSVLFLMTNSLVQSSENIIISPSTVYNGNILMGIGEESFVETENQIDIPKGFQIVEENEKGFSIRAVKVGRWELSEEIVCVGVTKEDAKKYCDLL